MTTRLEKCPECPRNKRIVASRYHTTAAKRAPSPPANRAAACVAVAAAFDDVVDDPEDVLEDELAG